MNLNKGLRNKKRSAGEDRSRPGFHTVVTAEQYLRQEVPEIKEWMCWVMKPEYCERALSAMIGDGLRHSGTWGAWSWERVPCSYANTCFWGGSTRRPEIGLTWIGLVKIRGAKGEEFMMFSYQDPDNGIGKELMVSTGDTEMLRRFADDLDEYFSSLATSKTHLHVNVINGMNMKISMSEEEKLYLPKKLVDDVDNQVLSFFSGGDLYKRLGVPHRRGLLFTGAPGTGKTMMIRRLARLCRAEYDFDCRYLAINAAVDSADLEMFFRGGSQKRPVLLILEDLESLTRETRITRSELLARLDGLEPANGTLLLATANNPGQIDPALLHRPSRFDRVWSFPLPDSRLRHRYLKDAFPDAGEEALKSISSRSSNWTLAYLKELKMTAGILAIRKGSATIEDGLLLDAYEVLENQFSEAQKEHSYKNKSESPAFGFNRSRQSPWEDETAA